MSSQAAFPISQAPIPPRFMKSDEENTVLINRRDAVIREVGYPKIEELGVLFSEIIPGTGERTCPLNKRHLSQEIGQAAFDAYNEVAKDEVVSYVCLVAYFYKFRELYPALSARGVEMSWKFVGGKDPDTVWFP